MINLSAIRAKATKEISQPTLESTRQFLEVLALEMEQGEPAIAEIRLDEPEAMVFFRIRDERFFLALYLELQPELKVRWVEIESGSRVSLWIGHPEHDVPIAAVFSPVARSNAGFLFEPVANETESAERKIENLLEILAPHADAVRELSQRTTMCLRVAYYGYTGQMWGVHLELEMLRQLADLGIEVDLDLYAGGAALR